MSTLPKVWYSRNGVRHRLVNEVRGVGWVNCGMWTSNMTTAYSGDARDCLRCYPKGRTE